VIDVTGKADSVRAHLREVLDSDIFRRAELQARALELIVEAQLSGERLQARQLATLLYGQSGDAFIKAVRQLMREIRLKLPVYYEQHPDSGVSFRLLPNSYRLAIDFVPPRTLGARAEGHAESGRRKLQIGATLAGIVMVLLAAFSFRWFVIPEPPVSSLNVTREGLVARAADGSRAPAFEERVSELIGFDLPAHYLEGREFLRALRLPRQGGWGFAVFAADPTAAASPPREEAQGSSTLYMIDDRARRLASLELPVLPGELPRPRSLRSSDGLDSFPILFKALSAAPVELDGDGLRDELLISIAQFDGFPCQVLGLDPRDPQRLLVDFWNSGHAQAAVVQDADGNGADEIIVHGQNNDHQRAVAVVLSPAPGVPLRGRSPGGDRGKSVREVRHYPVVGKTFRFPRTATATSATFSAALRDVLRAADRDAGSGEWVFTIQDSGRHPYRSTRPRIVYRVDARRRTVRADILDEDVMVLMLARLIEEERLDDRWSVAEELRLDLYEEHLAQQVEVFDAASDEPHWRRVRDLGGGAGDAPALSGREASITTPR
jgi:hypothetical protein